MLRRLKNVPLLRSLLLLTLIALGGCTSQKLYNVQQTPVESGLTMTQVKNAIMKACEERAWLVRPLQPGVLRADLEVRTHTAEIEIRYNTTHYDIVYLDSENLDYNGSKIHRNYNKWIKLLDREIQQEMISIAYD